ncbi:MAG: 2Fe-2S iron-sulfur cluster-binding protein, partial [Melioribacteraceae bacterium]
MIQFIFNNELINTDFPPASVLLDFIRKEKKLTGTKEGCREGDCGACTVLIGELIRGSVRYKPVNSCLVPIRDVHGKHLVTVEFLGQSELSPVQTAIIEEGGTQCGFCTPGFVVSITGYLLNSRCPNLADAIEALGGNICRCTGYAGIERAIEKSLEKFNQCDPKKEHIDKLIDANFIPAYFKSVGKQLINIRQAKAKINSSKYFVGGGTDLYVQNWEELIQSDADFLSDRNIPAEILSSKNKIKIGAGATIQQILESPVIRKYFPDLQNDLKLFGSLPIRNRATAAGNI